MRGFRALAGVFLVAGAAGHGWEFLALQAPSSPWHVTGMPLAVGRFAVHAWLLGLAVWALAPREPPRGLLAVTAVGGALNLGALAVSAATGLLGVQLRDARAGSPALVAARLVGALLLAVALGWALRARGREP
ncbi:MAG: hypothetical protein HY909_24050 [Deltaproteobacteria bacterium]|nr:hypothetical protein [Deltaproteobacteria bacterium]